MVDLAYEFINMSDSALYKTAFAAGFGWGIFADICVVPFKNKDVFYSIQEKRIKNMVGKIVPPTIIHGLLHSYPGVGVMLDLDPVKNIYNAFLVGVVAEECLIRVGKSDIKKVQEKLGAVYREVKDFSKKK
ncbi:MAG: hypothetical protein KAS12_04940 [Candidatus Aenigmarchaeota archaeon]|nr:hypothetical protein [Candidatus Aenigmarchaeota archaeon]